MITIAMLLAMAIILQLVEPGLPLAVPGVKLGLANIIGLIALYLYGPKEMIAINLLRVFMAALLRGNLFATGFWLSLGGVILSTVMVIILKKFSKLSIVGLAMASSVFHGLGQILVVSYIYRSIFLASYLPVMWLLSIPTGILTGIISRLVIKTLTKKEV